MRQVERHLLLKPRYRPRRAIISTKIHQRHGAQGVRSRGRPQLRRAQGPQVAVGKTEASPEMPKLGALPIFPIGIHHSCPWG